MNVGVKVAVLLPQSVEIPVMVVVAGRTSTRGVPSHNEYALTPDGYIVEVLVQFKVDDDQLEATGYVRCATCAFQKEAD